MCMEKATILEKYFVFGITVRWHISTVLLKANECCHQSTKHYIQRNNSCRSQNQSSLWRGSAVSSLLELRFRIPPWARMSVSCER